jgi:hypothetical protein
MCTVSHVTASTSMFPELKNDAGYQNLFDSTIPFKKELFCLWLEKGYIVYQNGKAQRGVVTSYEVRLMRMLMVDLRVAARKCAS